MPRPYTGQGFVPVVLLLVAFPQLAFPQLAFSQPSSEPPRERLVFERLSVEQGLSQVTVVDVLQDRQGFLWFATQDGLSRYDGYGFEVYRPAPGNPQSLSSNLVTALYEDAEGTLWVGTNEGLNRLNRWRGTFTRFRHDSGDSTSLGGDVVTALTEGPEGKLWVGSARSGLSRLDDPAQGTFTRFRHNPQDSTSLASDVIPTLHTGAGGTLWVATTDGLDRFQPETGTFAHAMRGRIPTAVRAEPSGRLWVGTAQSGLHRFDPEQGVTATYRHDRDDPQSLTGGAVTGIAGARGGGREGTLWIGTWRGLSLFDPQAGTFTQYRHRPDDPQSLSDDRVTDVVEGCFGTLWVGTGEGVSRSDRQSGTFAVYRHRPGDPNSLSESSIYGIYEDEDGILWVGTLGGGLNRVDRSAGTVTRYYHEPGNPRSLSDNYVGALAEDAQGHLWVGSRGGLDRLDRRTGAFEHHPLGATDSARAQPVTVLRNAPGGTFWVGTARSGLYRFDPEQGGATAHYQAADDSSGLSGNSIQDIEESGDGRLWVATAQSGLSLFDPATGTAEHFRHAPDDPASLSSDYVVTVHRDQKGRLWAATFGGGLNRFDPDAPEAGFTRYTEQNSGLPSNSLAGLLEDDEGHLWISTYAGLVQFDPERETFRTYGPDRGVQSTEFNNGAYHKSRDGEMFFGGVNGLNAFFPENVDVNPHPPEVVLTDALIRTRGYSAGRDSTFRLREEAAARLGHDQNDLTFEYVGLHYAAPARNTYAYRLEGYDADWQDAGTRRQAIYTNLDPGDYTFRVRAANRDGVWSDEKALLAFTIRPPWWRTWWAYGGYLLILALGVLAVDRFQRRRLVRREREKAMLREAELKAEIAQRENTRKTQELEEARQLQLSMLPKTTPALPQAEIAAHMQTATEVGGDYYDFRRTEDGALLFAIGDATGHGLRAGAMVTAAKTLFNSLPDDGQGNVVNGHGGLAHALHHATRVLRRLGMRRLYMALALGRLAGNRLELAGAGLPPALVYRAAQGTVEEVPLNGMPLGGLAGFPYRQRALTLAPGDVVVLMSDGFAEAFDAERRMLGYDRAATVLRETASASPSEIITCYEETARQWTGEAPLSDDMTFIVLKMRPVRGGP